MPPIKFLFVLRNNKLLNKILQLKYLYTVYCIVIWHVRALSVRVKLEFTKKKIYWAIDGCRHT